MELTIPEKTIEDIHFPVSLQNLYYGEKADIKKKTVTGYKCIINANTGVPLSIVSNSYKLITHKEAFNFGLDCMHKLFDVAKNEISVFKVTASQNCTVAFIDLLHKSYEINLWQQEVYVPYLRVTNSYNKSRALRFDLGFVRKLCSNGCIFEQQTIQFNYPHTKRAASDIEFVLPAGKMDKFKKDFETYLTGIKDMSIDKNLMFPLFLKAIDYNIANINNSDETKNRFELLKSSVEPLLAKYEKQFNNSIYTVFNAATDYSSTRLNKDNSASILTSGLQRKCGNWLSEFNTLKSKPDFSFVSYLGNYAKFSLN